MRKSGSFFKWALLAMVSLVLSVVVLCSLGKWLYVPDGDAYYGKQMPEDVRGQLNYFYWIWDDPQRKETAHKLMRDQNPEWDMISRTFLAYSLANVALQYSEEKERALKYLDLVIDDSVKVPWRDFMLPYGKDKPFVRQPATSVMVDGEISLMIGLRRLVSDRPGYRHRRLHGELIERCVKAIEAGPIMCGECYPDECWTWCNPLALTSVKVYDILEGTDHSELFAKWEECARAHLVDPDTKLLYSAVTLDGKVIHKPEGSTIWISAYCIKPLAPTFAEEQYKLMREKLSGNLLFYSYGREWPVGQTGEWDIDSGFTPFGMGPASTGFALVASKEMNDREFFARLLGFLNFVGVPETEDGRLRYQSSNLVGDATFLLGKTTGPAWAEIERRWQARKGGGK